jgi:hypothetical protein
MNSGMAHSGKKEEAMAVYGSYCVLLVHMLLYLIFKTIQESSTIATLSAKAERPREGTWY